MRPSVDSLLTWMRQAPRTFNWNAIVAYDRNKTNTVLRQEYIDRFSTDSYLPPFEGQVPTTDNEIEWVYDYLLDAPRLSFENSVIASSKAMLTMTIMGGAQICISENPGSPPAVTRVASYDALQGPKYYVDIDLLYAAGSVDSAGSVQLDLGSGRNPLLYFAPTLNQRTKGGKFMQGKLAGLEPEIKTFELNEMGSQAGQFLQPGSFFIRTHAEPHAKVARAANFGEGAVLLFATMKGEANGQIPALDEDLMFLVPAGDFSASILLGQRFLLSKIMFEALRKLANDGQITCKLTGPDLDFAEGIAVEGERRHPVITATDLPHFKTVTQHGLHMAFGAGFQLDVDRNKELLMIHWSGTSNQSTSTVETLSGSSYVDSMGFSWNVAQAFRFQLQGDTGELKLTLVPEGQVRQLKVSPGGYSEVPAVREHFAEIADVLETWLADELDTAFAQFASVVEEIDVFRLNSLLFRGTNVVHFSRAQAPGDLALLGQLAPDLTHFAVAPLEPRVGAAGQLQFKTEPAVAGVTWHVDNIAGDTGNAGSIDANGKFTAPPKADIAGFFKRVRVTARKDQYSSSALVTVLVREIVVNPFIQICGASTAGNPNTRELAAGSLSSGALTWKVVGNSGSTVAPSNEEGGDHTFTACMADPTESFTLDEIAVTDSAGKTDSSWILVVHKIVNLTIVVRPLAADRVQLVVDLGQGEIPPEEAEKYGVSWSILKGGGQIDPTKGVYQVDPASSMRFALVTATISSDNPLFPPYKGYIILPLPLIELPTLMDALERSDSYFRAVPILGAERAGKILTGEA